MELLIGLILAILGAFLPGISTKQKLVLLAVIATLAASIWWLRRPGVEIAIAYPLNGGEVALREPVRGESVRLADGDQLWLAVFSHDVARYYFQALPPLRDGSGDWSLTTQIGVEGDVGRRFDLVAFFVADEALPALTDYIESGQTTGSWDGLASLPDGFDELARITVIRLGDDVVPPPPVTDEERALQTAVGFLDAWVAADYDLMCTFREPCIPDWVGFMRSFPVPVRDYEIGPIARDGDAFSVAYDIKLPDHGSLAGAFIESPDAHRWAAVLGVTGAYVTWEDTLVVRDVEGEFRVVSSPGTVEEGGSARISGFLWSLGMFDTIGPFVDPDDVGERLVSYWALVGVEFGLEMAEVELLIKDGLDQYDAYVERLNLIGELAGQP